MKIYYKPSIRFYGLVAKIILTACLCYAVNVSAQDTVTMEQYVTGLTASYDSGRSDIVGLIGLFLIILVAAYAAVYFKMREDIMHAITDEIRFTECKSLLNHGVQFFLSSNLEGVRPLEKVVLLNSAISTTRHAMTICKAMPDSDNKKRPFKAVITTNIGYFCVNAALASSKTSPSYSKKMMADASSTLEASLLSVESVERSKYEDHGLSWFRITESKLYIQYSTEKDKRKREAILKELRILLDNMDVPASWAAERKDYWEDKLAAP